MALIQNTALCQKQIAPYTTRPSLGFQKKPLTRRLMEHHLLAKFDQDFREYIESAVRFAELQTPYRPLDIEDEIRWIKNWIKENCYARD